MNVREKLLMDGPALLKHGPINIAVLGDSVSHGEVSGYYDYENVYWNVLKRKLHQFRDYVPINVINAAVSGTTAKEALPRIESQVLSHHPDLVIICFGLNDVTRPLEEYIQPLAALFDTCLQAQCHTIFMTPNMLNSYVADDTLACHRDYAAMTAEIQTGGRMDRYMQAAVELAKSKGVPVCDCYAQWKELAKTKDTTMLLANRVNHPTPAMHQLFADALYAMIMNEV
ncbi:MAG: GDSL family lipase [Clostridia bacterium]|nr:GDSL family lipase [Clostridia bacterium]